MTDLVKFFKENNISTNVGDFIYKGKENKEKGKIGEGGNSYVYLFEKNGKNFAIKFLKQDSNSKKIKRFQDEYFALAQLPKKECLIEQYHLDKITIENSNYYIIISKYYDMNLAKYKKDIFDTFSKETQEKVVNLVFDKLLSALEHIHKHNIIHRDLKPENIFINYNKEKPEDIHLVIGDFGIAKFDENIYSKESETAENERLGNRDFSAPEQSIPGSKISYASDIFSFGQIIYWLKFGEPLKGIDGRLSDNNHLELIIKICLKKDPKERFKDIKSLEQFRLDIKNNKYDLRDFLYEFDNVIRKNAPEINTTSIIKNRKDISTLIDDLNNINRNNFLWHMNFDEGDYHLSSIDKCPFSEDIDNTYVIKSAGTITEINIKDIVLFRDKNNPINNLIIIRTGKMPFFVYYDKFGNKKRRTIRSNAESDIATFIGDKCIDPEETKNGYYKDSSDNSRKIIGIDDFFEVERRIKPYLYVIAPKETALNNWSRDGKSKKYLERIMNSDNIDNNINGFIKHIQKRSNNYQNYRRTFW